MNKQFYCMKCEAIDDSIFKQLNDKYNIFTDLQRQELYSRYDFTGISTKLGKLCSIELKCRDNIDYPTLFIEKGKYEYLIKLYKDTGMIPVYINFTKEGKGIIYNLLAIKNPELIQVTIYNKMNQRYEKVWRYLLPKENGILL